MAEIGIEELIRIIKSHPDYLQKWELGTPAEQALYIKFSEEKLMDLQSDDYETLDGSTLVIDKNQENQVFGIEIV